MTEIRKSDFLVWVVDDDPDILDALRFSLEANGWSIRTYTSTNAFLEEVDMEQPGCIILDIRMPEITGIELQDILLDRNCLLPVIFLTGHGDMNTAIRAFRHGAYDFLQKPASPGELLALLEQTKSRFEEKLSALSQMSPKTRYEQLTERQQQVLASLAAGLDTEAISQQLGISPRTLQRHRQNVMRLLGLKNASEAKAFLDQALLVNKTGI